MSEKHTMQPDYLYKYYSPLLIENIFVNKTIRFTPVQEFNDPFEALIGMDNIRNWYVRIENGIEPIDAKDKMERSKNIRELVLGEFGIFCLSAKHDDIKMWSHYADSHKGFVIKFKMDCKFFNEFKENGFGIKQVNYKESRFNLSELQEKLELLKKTNQIENINRGILFELVFNKSIVWEHEQEYRLIAPYFSCVKACKNVNVKYTHMGLYPLSPDSISEVILGARMDFSDKERIKHFIEYDDAIKHIKIKEAKLDDINYKIVTE